MAKVTIAVDALGGDRGMAITIPASIQAVRQHPNLHLILVGKADVLKQQLQKYYATESDLARIVVEHASEEVAMDENPVHAMRYKKDSSMRVAINLVKSNDADACVSAGNTGAYMATAKFVLKTLPGIKRPALMGLVPSKNKLGVVRVLDLGANVDVDSDVLFQFAIMGSVLSAAVDNIKSPRVGLLNNGVEETKGNDTVKKTAQALAVCEDINYVGYIEGDTMFFDEADVVVCDGFVGNIALKSVEGMTKFMIFKIKEAFRRNLWTKLAAVCALFVLQPFMTKRMSPDLFNGANFLGLRGTVVKSHGSTTVRGYVKAIEAAMLAAERNVPDLIEHEVSHLLSLHQTSDEQ